MPLSTQLPFLYFLETEEKGRAVFSSEDIPRGTLIESAPVIILNAEDTARIHQTHLHDYYFTWDLDAKTSAIALGYGSLYNHSDTPNASFELDRTAKAIRFIAIQDIPANKEITVDYIALKDEGYNLWF